MLELKIVINLIIDIILILRHSYYDVFFSQF